MKTRKINIDSIVNNLCLSPLLHIPKPPQTLYIKGTIPTKRAPIVAIVGTRRPSSYGREVTHTLATDLARRGVIIVSGLASGIDAIAHTAALEAGGTTIAVVAQGLHAVYPASNMQLAKRIIKQGAIISEYEDGVEARKHHFLARNRIVSGIADAVIVIEAALKSGTASTVGHALEQNREVFAVPGRITSLLSVGPNNLLKQGARPVTNAEDVLNVIAPHLTTGQKQFVFANTPQEAKILTLIQQGVRDGDQLLDRSGLSPSEFSQTLTMMELNGTIRPLGGHQWTI